MSTRLTDAVKDAANDAALTDADTLSLHTGDPGAAGTANELDGEGSAPGYARGTTAFDASASGVSVTNIDTVFTADGGAWPEVTHVGIWAASVFLMSVPLSAYRTIADTQTLTFAAGDVALTASGAA